MRDNTCPMCILTSTKQSLIKLHCSWVSFIHEKPLPGQSMSEKAGYNEPLTSQPYNLAGRQSRPRNQVEHKINHDTPANLAHSILWTLQWSLHSLELSLPWSRQPATPMSSWSNMNGVHGKVLQLKRSQRHWRKSIKKGNAPKLLHKFVWSKA